MKNKEFHLYWLSLMCIFTGGNIANALNYPEHRAGFLFAAVCCLFAASISLTKLLDEE